MVTDVRCRASDGRSSSVQTLLSFLAGQRPDRVPALLLPRRPPSPVRASTPGGGNTAKAGPRQSPYRCRPRRHLGSGRAANRLRIGSEAARSRAAPGGGGAQVWAICPRPAVVRHDLGRHRRQRSQRRTHPGDQYRFPRPARGRLASPGPTVRTRPYRSTNGRGRPINFRRARPCPRCPSSTAPRAVRLDGPQWCRSVPSANEDRLAVPDALATTIKITRSAAWGCPRAWHRRATASGQVLQPIYRPAWRSAGLPPGLPVSGRLPLATASRG
jgi:hypothetical protein